VALVVAPLLLFELTVRLASPLPAVAAYLYHPRVVPSYEQALDLEELLDMSILGFRPRTLRSDFVLSSRSLRTTEYADEKPPGTVRILTIGDSFSFSCAGVPYEEMWHHGLAQSLRASSGAEVELLNLSVPATESTFALRMWELEGSRLDADFVVFGFPVGSNFGEAAAALSRPSPAERMLAWSYGFRLVDNVVRRWLHPPTARRAAGEGSGTREQVVGGLLMSELHPGFEYHYDPRAPEMDERRFQTVQQRYYKICTGRDTDGVFEPVADTLVRLSASVEQSGAMFLLMIIPAELQFRSDLVHQVAEQARNRGKQARSDALDSPQSFLRGSCEREGVRFLDLLPAFETAPSDERYYRPRGTHWNPTGNAFAGRALHDHLTAPSAADGESLWEQIQRRP
jgi:hypothetical protein